MGLDLLARRNGNRYVGYEIYFSLPQDDLLTFSNCRYLMLLLYA